MDFANSLLRIEKWTSQRCECVRRVLMAETPDASVLAGGANRFYHSNSLKDVIPVMTQLTLPTTPSYSCLKASTGSTLQTRHVCELTVINAINTVIRPTAMKGTAVRSTR